MNAFVPPALTTPSANPASTPSTRPKLGLPKLNLEGNTFEDMASNAQSDNATDAGSDAQPTEGGRSATGPQDDAICLPPRDEVHEITLTATAEEATLTAPVERLALT